VMHAVTRKCRKFSPEFKGEAVKSVIDGSRPIAQVARELGINEGRGHHEGTSVTGSSQEHIFFTG
jgi:Transposase